MDAVVPDAGPAAVLEVLVPRLDADEASGILWLSGGVTAIAERTVDDGETIALRAGITSFVDVTRVIEMIGDRWPATVVAEDVDEWVTEARAQAEVLPVGDRLVLVPPGKRPDATPEDALIVTLDAAAAFGSGSHPTTRMALAALERLVESGMAVLDVGCGSGVLAITAAMLGADRVLAIDVDEVAVGATQANVASNDGAAVVEASSTPIGAVAESFDIVVANLTAGTLIDLAAVLVERANPGGQLLLTGVLERRAAEVTSAYEALGLFTFGYNESDGWSLLELRRPS